MHRLSAFLLVLLTAALYGALATIARPAQAAESPQPAANEGPQPHIALLLPLNSQSFAPAAEAVRRGVMAAAKVQGSPLPVKDYATDSRDESVLAAYRQAVQAGARVVIGPLTRDAVAVLARNGPAAVPTLALNVLDGEVLPPSKFYLFGLSAEAEARQVARAALARGYRNAITVAAGTSLAKRTQAAFADEWQRLGGTLVLQAGISSNPERLAALHEKILAHPGDVIFLAAGPGAARLARPYLSVAVPTYATSLIYDGHKGEPGNIDLTGIHFVEMPWLLILDHPAAMIYPRPDPALSVDLERLYALGIDAFRLATILVKEPDLPEGTTLDGVTGQITLNAHQFARELVDAQFRQGDAVPLAAGQSGTGDNP
jgi:outer membrane PBP1 activator LpoA protein